MEVAIIGMAGRFPGARNLDELWQNLKSGVESITSFDREALERAGAAPDLLALPNFVGAKGVLEDFDRFDAELFGYSPEDAARMDPQTRLFHECVWEALEAAGYDPSRSPATIGLFGGANPHVRWQLAQALRGGSGSEADAFSSSQLADRDYLCSLVAYRLGLLGPVCLVTTACSTSLVAVHLACQALIGGECDVAVAGGAAATLPMVDGYVHEPGMVMSADGHCRPFDEGSSGIVEGCAVGAVVLKLLEHARRDGDHIRAVIRGTAVNNDGRDKVGYTAPSVEGQARVIRAAHHAAGVDPSSIGFIETHGTATALGDPIEVEALRLAFADSRRRCGLGSIKANIGHTGMAAGISGLIKAVLCLEHELLPPTVNFRKPNPKIDFTRTPFYVVAEPTKWERQNGEPRRAGVSSFGVGGTNAHAVLEEAPPAPARADRGRTWQVLPLNGATAEAVRQLGGRLGTAFASLPEAALADAAYTLQVGRKPLAFREAIVCSDVASARAALEGLADDGQPAEVPRGDRRVVWMFSGQGSQYVGMGRGLEAQEPAFRHALAHGFELFRATSGIDLRDALYPAPGRALSFDRQDVSQPLIFAFEYALAKLLEHYGLKPYAMIGYSFGEYAAACVAGVLSLEDAMRLVALRGRLMQQAPPGAMVSVALTEEELAPLLGQGLSVAVANGPSCVVAGSPEVVKEFERDVRKRGQMPLRLGMAYAGHSAALDELMAPFEALLEQVRLSPPNVPYVSSLTGAFVTPEQATSRSYWAQQMRGTVRFAKGISALTADPATVFVELGPGRDLVALTARFVGDASDERLFSLIQHHESRADDAQYFTNVLAQLWKRGVDVDWTRMHPEGGRRIPLPTYPFATTRHGIDDGDFQRALRGAAAPAPEPLTKHPDPAAWFYLPVWRKSLPRASAPATGRRVLVADGGSGVGRRLVEALAAAGADAVVAPESPPGAGRPDWHPDVVVDLAALELGPCEGAEDFARRQEARARRLVALARGTGEGKRASELLVLTRGAVEITGAETIDPDQMATAPVCRVLAQENFGLLRVRHVDVDDLEPAPHLAAIANEVLSVDAEVQCAYRNGRRWLPAYERLDGRAKPDEARLNAKLRARGVYLVTGGLGGVGLLLARHLAKTCQARLVLVSRGGTSPKVEAAVRQIEADGGEVMLAPADVGDRRSLRAVLDAAKQRFGRLNGVIHAAAVVSGDSFRAIEALRPEDWETQLRGKVRGADVLARELAGQPLDFVLLMSSISTVLGGLGYGAYVAANAYLDALAIRERRNGAPFVSVAWDGWDVAGPGVGIGSSFTELAMNAAEGFAAFRHAIAFDEVAHWVHSTSDLEVRLKQWVNQDARPAPAAAPRAARPRPALVTPLVAPRDELEEEIAGLWRTLLGYKKIGVHDEFLELEGDSLKAINLATQLHARFGISLRLEEFFKRTTIAAQAEAVRAAQGDRSGGERITPAPAPAPAPSPVMPPAPSLEPTPAPSPVTSPAHRGRPTVQQIQAGEGAQIVLVHPVEGTVFSYYPLARMLPARSVLGLESPFLRDPSAQASSLGELANCYVDALEPALDGSPWWLGGWSMGGVLAVEMLRCLRGRGLPEPAGLLLIDSWLPELVRSLTAGAERVSEEEERRQFLERLNVTGTTPNDYLQSLTESRGSLFRAYRRNRDLFEAWSVAPLPAKALLVLAEGHQAEDLSENLRRWKEVTQGGVSAVKLPGDHYGIVSAWGAHALAKVVSKYVAGELSTGEFAPGREEIL